MMNARTKALSERTHCKHGHPFDAGSDKGYQRGRRCQTCALLRQAKYRDKMKAVRAELAQRPRREFANE